MDLSLVVTAGAYYPVAVYGLLIAVASHCGPQNLECLGTEVAVSGFWSTGLIIAAHWLRCSVACGIFQDEGSNPCLLQWQVDSLPLSHEGSLSLIKLVNFGSVSIGEL